MCTFCHLSDILYKLFANFNEFYVHLMQTFKHRCTPLPHYTYHHEGIPSQYGCEYLPLRRGITHQKRHPNAIYLDSGYTEQIRKPNRHPKATKQDIARETGQTQVAICP